MVSGGWRAGRKRDTLSTLPSNSTGGADGLVRVTKDIRILVRKKQPSTSGGSFQGDCTGSSRPGAYGWGRYLPRDHLMECGADQVRARWMLCLKTLERAGHLRRTLIFPDCDEHCGTQGGQRAIFSSRLTNRGRSRAQKQWKNTGSRLGSSFRNTVWRMEIEMEYRSARERLDRASCLTLIDSKVASCWKLSIDNSQSFLWGNKQGPWQCPWLD